MLFIQNVFRLTVKLIYLFFKYHILYYSKTHYLAHLPINPISSFSRYRLEEKQRQKRKKKEAEAEAATAKGEHFDNAHHPVWFHKEQDVLSGTVIHKYNGDYWDCKNNNDWSKCPDLYGKD